MLKNTGQLTKEFINRVKPMELDVDCPMDGNFNSEIAIVAEAPGETEKRMRVPLVGGSGQLLWRSLGKHGIRRTDVYITNVIKRQLSMSTKGNDKAKIGQAEKDRWKAMLVWEIRQLPNVKYLLCLGGVALEAFMPYLYHDDGSKVTSQAGVTMWRGSVLTMKIDGREIKVLITFNPAAVIREPRFEIVFHMDIGKKFMRLINNTYVPYEIKHNINPSFNEAMQWLDDMQDCKVPVAFDLEVVSGETACLGFARDDHEGHCINLRTLDKNRFSLFEERKLIRRAQKLFEDPDMQLIAQNGVFDTAWLWYKDRIKVHHVWFDTLLAHHTLFSTLPHNLGFLTSQYTMHPFYKDEGKSWKEGGDIDLFWLYNVKDACITRRISTPLLNELRDAQLENFFFDHVMRLQPHLVHMIVGGVRADTVLKDEITTVLQEELDQHLKAFYAAVEDATGNVGYNPNPLSNPQLQDLFFRKLKLVGRGLSTGKENRKRMRSHPRTSPEAAIMIDKLDKYKEEHKFFSTYATSKLDADARFRCEYKQFGTQEAPGRLSSSKTSWDTGMNLQNQPERSKGMFIADEGCALGYFDLSQAEARFVGWDANIEQWKKDFEHARMNPGTYDCHRALAAQMWNIPYDETPKKDVDENGKHTRRYIAKRCRHGLNYRMMPERLSVTTGLSYRDSRDAFNIYHHVTPELMRKETGWWDSIIRQAKTKPHTLYNAYGRRLIILERIDDNSLDSIIAFRPQSTIGDKVSRVIYQSMEDDKWPFWARLSLNIHDALICLAHEDKMKTCLSIMRKYAEEPIIWPSIVTGEMCELIIPAEMKVTSKRTSWRMEEQEDSGTQKLVYFEDANGEYRWSHMDDVEVEAA